MKDIEVSLGINIACTSEIDIIENNKQQQQQHMDVVELSGI